jgi:hypothetical protein
MASFSVIKHLNILEQIGMCLIARAIADTVHMLFLE